MAVASARLDPRPSGRRHSVEWTDSLLKAFGGPGWTLHDGRGYTPALEHDVESRFAVGNGFLGVRGSMETVTDASRPRTYVAGLFDVLPEGSHVPGLLPIPDWLRLQLFVGEEPLTIDEGETLMHERTLDLARGVLLVKWHQQTAGGEVVRLRTLRFVSLADRAIATQIVRIEVDRPLSLTLKACLEPVSDGLLLTRSAADLSEWRAPGQPRHVAVASSGTLRVGGGLIRGQANKDGERQWTWAAAPGRPADLHRLIAVAQHDGNDGAGDTARRLLRRARRAGGRNIHARHARAWRERWAAGDVSVEGDDEAQRALRFATYHLISAANPESSRASVGARALTGDGYLGHVFWDTEIFLLPFYTLTWPAAARAMLLYRFRTLPAARAKARRLGYRGALYAWESADTGEETTPPYAIGPQGEIIPIRCGIEEHHISADIAYAVWQYWEWTRDTSFLRDAGAEIMLETARFWASRGRLEADGRYHIRGVIGPDEYHEGVDDNVYTNHMARWNLERGIEVARLLQRRWPERWVALRDGLGLDADELAQWRDVADRLTTGFDAKTGLFEQFEGFFKLEPIDLKAYASRNVPVDVVLGADRTRRSQVIKQADVLMLLALLRDDYSREMLEANFRYYEPRCGHGSSLSPAVHALVAARLGKIELATKYFRQTAAIDLDDTMGNAAAGVHIAALGGLWQTAVLGFAGFNPGARELRFTPNLPRSWRSLEFPIQWRGRRLRIRMRQEAQTFAATLERGRPLTIRVGDERHRLRTGEVWTAPLSLHETEGKEVLR